MIYGILKDIKEGEYRVISTNFSRRGIRPMNYNN